MAIQPINQRYVQAVTLDGTGAGSVQIIPRADFVLQQTRWRVQGGSNTNQSTAETLINAEFFDGTQTGNNDVSRSSRLITPSDRIECDWTGGPPGGTATLTLFGVEYPIGQGIPPPAGGTGPGNPILGGTTLVRDRIQSSNYVPGVSGWAIFQNGNSELNNSTIRGSLSAGGGTVLVNNGGVHVQGPSYQYDINFTGGFLARPVVTDGSESQLNIANDGTANVGALILSPETPTRVNHVTLNPAELAAGYNHSGGTDTPYLEIFGPQVSGKAQPFIQMLGQDNVSGTDNSQVNLSANQINLGSNGNVVTNRPRWCVNWGTPSIANNVVQVLTPSSVDVNTGGMGSGSTVTIPTVDVWDVGCILRFATNNTNNRMVRILLNGSELQSFVMPTVNGFNTTVGIAISKLFQAGDQLQFTGFQTSGAALSLTGNGNVAWVMKALA